MGDDKSLWLVRVKFLTPGKTQITDVPLSKVFTYDKSSDKHVPFKPSHPRDFKPKTVYIVKTDLESADGNDHPYWALIGGIAGKAFEVRGAINFVCLVTV